LDGSIFLASPEQTAAPPATSTLVYINVQSNVSNEHNIVKDSPVDTEAVSPSSPVPAEALKEEEIVESDPVTPVTPLSSDQQQQETELELSTNSNNNNTINSNNNTINSNNNNTTVPKEPLVADVNDIVHSEANVELRYTIADVDVLDKADLEVTDSISYHHTKLGNFEELTSAEAVVDKSSEQGEVGMYQVDTTDKATLPNGHSVQPSTHDSNENISDSVMVANGDVPTFGRLASKEFDVVVKLDTGEKRFGFSVIGGSDEGFPARVESIAGG